MHPRDYVCTRTLVVYRSTACTTASSIFIDQIMKTDRRKEKQKMGKKGGGGKGTVKRANPGGLTGPAAKKAKKHLNRVLGDKGVWLLILD